MDLAKVEGRPGPGAQTGAGVMRPSLPSGQVPVLCPLRPAVLCRGPRVPRLACRTRRAPWRASKSLISSVVVAEVAQSCANCSALASVVFVL
eukprot:2589051-Pyramimonas_sp.AAC.1